MPWMDRDPGAGDDDRATVRDLGLALPREPIFQGDFHEAVMTLDHALKLPP